MADTKLLNKLLQTPQKLAKEINAKTVGRLTHLLDSLIDQNYVFTQDQFELYLDQACEQIRNKHSFIGIDTPTLKKINIYMINKFTITETHATKILTGLSNVYYSNNLYILDVLFTKQYIFTVPQFKQMMKFNYHPTIIINTINNNCVYLGCKSMSLTRTTDISPQFTNLIDNLKKGYQFTNEHLAILLLITGYYGYYNVQTSQLDSLLNLLLLDVQDTDALLKILSSNINCRHEVHKYILKYIINKFGFNEELVQFIFKDMINDEPNMLLHLMLKGYIPTTQNLNQLLEYNRAIIIPLPNINNYDTINLPSTFLSSCIKNDKVQLLPIELFERFNISPNLATLNTTCKNGRFLETKMLLEKYNIIPEKNTLDWSIKSLNLELIQTILNFKLTPDTHTFHILNPGSYRNDTKDKILEMLINYGLMITINDIDDLLRQQYAINDLSRFNIPYDEKLYFMCYCNNYYPKEYLNYMTLNKKTLELHELCKTSTFNIITKYIQETNTKLDKYCMSFLMKDGLKLLAIINKYGCKPCEFAMYKNLNNKDLEEWALKEYKITEFTMLEEYDMKCE
jgi:hypothetical protein